MGFSNVWKMKIITSDIKPPGIRVFSQIPPQHMRMVIEAFGDIFIPFIPHAADLQITEQDMQIGRFIDKTQPVRSFFGLSEPAKEEK